jgi:hypothetical protein
MRENAVECQLQYQKLKTEHDTLHQKMGRLQDLSTKTNQAMKRLKIQSLQDKVWVLCPFFFAIIVDIQPGDLDQDAD